MKSKLLRIVRQRAQDCAHIDGYTVTTDLRGDHITGVSIGYATEEDRKLYGGVWHIDMDESTYNRIIRQKYWENNRKDYYWKYIMKAKPKSVWNRFFGHKPTKEALDRKIKWFVDMGCVV